MRLRRDMIDGRDSVLGANLAPVKRQQVRAATVRDRVQQAEHAGGDISTKEAVRRQRQLIVGATREREMDDRCDQVGYRRQRRVDQLL